MLAGTYSRSFIYFFHTHLMLMPIMWLALWNWWPVCKVMLQQKQNPAIIYQKERYKPDTLFWREGKCIQIESNRVAKMNVWVYRQNYSGSWHLTFVSFALALSISRLFRTHFASIQLNCPNCIAIIAVEKLRKQMLNWKMKVNHFEIHTQFVAVELFAMACVRVCVCICLFYRSFYIHQHYYV